MSIRDWLVYQVGDVFLSDCDGDTYTIKEAVCDIECRRCGEWILEDEPYARGTWHYSKFHIECARSGL